MFRQLGGKAISTLSTASRGCFASLGSVGAGGLGATAAGPGSSQDAFGYGFAFGIASVTAAGLSTAAFATSEPEAGMHCAQFPWPHDGPFSSFDHAAIRRGHQVYQQVCAACHSLERVYYREMIGVLYTEDEVKAIAEEAEIEDGPNEEGEMFTRPGKPADAIPGPYKNEAAARFANGGAYPPDLSIIAKARHDGHNYLFSLLLGYKEPPAGVEVREGLYYNPYFPGGAIAMPKMLMDEGTEYDDGTPATEAQQAKDVVSFLAWSAEPEHDERKLMGMKWVAAMIILLGFAVYYKRWKYAPLKSRRVIVDVVN